VLPHLLLVLRVQLPFPLRSWPTPPQYPVHYSSNPLEFPTTCFAIFFLKISCRVFLSVPPLYRCDRCPELHPLMPFVVVLSFLRHSDRLPPMPFLRLLPSGCCFGPRSLMPLLHVEPFKRLFPNVRPFQVSCVTFTRSYILRSCPPAAPLLYCGSSSHRLRPIPSAVHNFLESEFF
jgi:hypothetical protein